jgi:high-affinity Fe2+/Pb2+ permease
MSNIIDFKSVVSKLRNIDPTSFEDMKKQIVESATVSTKPETLAPLSDLRQLAGMPEADMSDKSIKKIRKTVDKMDKPKTKKSISKWAKGKFDDPKAAMFAIATNQQKRKEGKPIDPPGRESKSFIGKALIDEPKTLSGTRMRIDQESKTQPGAMGYHVKVEQDTLFDKNSREGKIVFVPYEVGMDYDDRLSMMEDGHTDTDSMQGITAQMAKDVMQLNQMFKDNPGDEELMTWITNKLAVAADKISSVKDYMMNPTQDGMTEEAHSEYLVVYKNKKGKTMSKMVKAKGLRDVADAFEKTNPNDTIQSIGTKSEGKMSNIALDMKQLSDIQFTSKYKKSKEEMKKELSEGADKNRAIRFDKMMRMGKYTEFADVLADAMHFAEVTKDMYGDTTQEGNAYAHAVRKAKMDGKKKGDKVKGPDGDEITLEKPIEEKAKPDYIDIDKDGDKKEPMKKAAKDAKKKKMSMDEKVQLLNIGKQIREMAKQHGVQPSQFLGYLVAKNPEKYGPLAKLEDIIDGKG